MARWRLTAPHYLNVEGVTWEYKEIPRGGGKQVRRLFPVPQHLHPDDPADWNYSANGDGEIIVSDGNNPGPKDIIFSGPPTPDMTPLDDEAKAISKRYTESWKHPIESLPGTYSQSLIDSMQEQMADIQSRPQQVQVEGVSEMMAAMTKVMEQNAEVIAALARVRRP